MATGAYSPYALILAARQRGGKDAIAALDPAALFSPGCTWSNIDGGDGLVEAVYLHQASGNGGNEFEVHPVEADADSPGDGHIHFILTCDRIDQGCAWFIEVRSEEALYTPSSHGSTAADIPPLLDIVDSYLIHGHGAGPTATKESGTVAKPLTKYMRAKIRKFEVREHGARQAASKKAYRVHLEALYDFWTLNRRDDGPPPVRAQTQDKVLDEFESIWGARCRKNMVADLDKGVSDGRGHLFGGVHIVSGGPVLL
ncbi:hypothetical protein JCM9279_005778 [Rhodotorula babjevae]